MVVPPSDSKRVTVETPGRAGRATETTIRYVEAGEGSPVVLLHGIGLDAADISWKHAIPALAEDHRVLAPDLPGHSKSDKPRVRYTTEYYIDALAAFLDALELSMPSLVGISMGGCIALGYALDHDVERLALVDSYGLGEDAPWRPMAAVGLRTPAVGSLLWQTMGATSETVRSTLDGYTTQVPDAFVDEIQAVFQDDDCGRTLRSWQRSEFRTYGFKTCYRDALPELGTPTLLVHGANDTLLPASWSERAAELLPDSELRVLTDCGHWPPRERPETFNDLLGAFLAS